MNGAAVNFKLAPAYTCYMALKSKNSQLLLPSLCDHVSDTIRVCLFAYVSMSVCGFVCVSVGLYVCLWVCMCVCVAVYNYVCLRYHQGLFVCLCLYVCLWVCMCVCVVVCKYVCSLFVKLIIFNTIKSINY